MLRVYALAGAVAQAETAALRADLAEFRKATQPMLFVFDAIERALKTLAPSVRETLTEWGVVVGVDHGELEVTKEFLCTLKSRGMARPFLFQNSLHNATLGFVSMHLGLTGPGATTCTSFFSGEDALDMACDYVRSGAAAACLAVGVEALDAEMVPAAQQLLGARARCANGAAAVVVASEAFVRQHGLTPLARLDGIRCHRNPGDTRLSQQDPEGLEGAPAFYGADAIQHVVHAFATVAERGAATVDLTKPDGTSSRIELAAGTEVSAQC